MSRHMESSKRSEKASLTKQKNFFQERPKGSKSQSPKDLGKQHFRELAQQVQRP